jgi:hypothetical protein
MLPASMVLVEICRGNGCYCHTNHLLSKDLNLYQLNYISYYGINQLSARYCRCGNGRPWFLG